MWKVNLPFDSPIAIRSTEEVWCNAYSPYERYTLREDALQWCAENDISPPTVRIVQDDETSKWLFNIWFDVELNAVAFRMVWG